MLTRLNGWARLATALVIYWVLVVYLDFFGAFEWITPVVLTGVLTVPYWVARGFQQGNQSLTQ